MLITWSYDRGRFEALTRFEDISARDALKTRGWRWAKAPVSRWFHTDPAQALPFSKFCDRAAIEHLQVNTFEREAAISGSQLASLDIDLPHPEGLDYFPFQKAGIVYALERSGALFGDEMGLGKTVQAIGVVNCDTEAKHILIVCPASLRLNWLREWNRWNVTGIMPMTAYGAFPKVGGGAIATIPRAAVILSYHMVHKFKAEILAFAPDVLICDESHHLKNTGARMTRAVLGFQRPDHPAHSPPIRARRTLFLTGTPIMNRPAELWSTVRRLDPKGLGHSREGFTERYVKAVGHLPELNARMRASFMVRRLKRDVMKELPPKTRQLVPLEVAGAADLLAAEDEVLQRQRRYLAELKQAAREGYAQGAMMLREGRTVAMAEIAKVRQQTALAKLPAAIDHIRAALDEQDKAVVFAHHHSVMDGLAAAFPDAVRLDGTMDDKARNRAVERFQNDAAVKVFIGSIHAAGQGLTLTASSYVAFVELDWTPARISQAEDRCHRIGQRDNVLVQHLVLDKSIDARMAQILVSKQAMLDVALGDAPDDGSTFDKLMEA